MFEVGDKVVDSGARAGGYGDYLRGGTPEMANWHGEKSVLTVFRVNSAWNVNAGIGPSAYNYHPSELRYATPGELKAAECEPENKPEIGPGSVVRRKSGAVFVVLSEKDAEGDYFAASVFKAPGRQIYLKDSDIESVTGTINEAGMFTPADKASESDGTETCKASARGDARPTWRDLKVGDVIRISDDNKGAYRRNRGKLTRVGQIDCDDAYVPIRVEGLEVIWDWVSGNAGDFEIIKRA